MNSINLKMMQDISEVDKIINKPNLAISALVDMMGGKKEFLDTRKSLAKDLMDSHDPKCSPEKTLELYEKNKDALLQYATDRSRQLGYESIISMLKSEDNSGWVACFDPDTLARALYDQTLSSHPSVVNFFVKFLAQQVCINFNECHDAILAALSGDMKGYLEHPSLTNADLVVAIIAMFGSESDFVEQCLIGAPAVEPSANDERFTSKNLNTFYFHNKERLLKYAECQAVWSGFGRMAGSIAYLMKSQDKSEQLSHLSSDDINLALNNAQHKDHPTVIDNLVRLLIQKVCDHHNKYKAAQSKETAPTA